jgi:hypothetical protein
MGEPVLLAVAGQTGTRSSTPSGPKRLSRALSRRLKGWAANATRAWSSDGGIRSPQGLGSAPELVEQILVEGHQPALGDIAIGDAEHPHGLPAP